MLDCRRYFAGFSKSGREICLRFAADSGRLIGESCDADSTRTGVRRNWRNGYVSSKWSLATKSGQSRRKSVRLATSGFVMTTRLIWSEPNLRYSRSQNHCCSALELQHRSAPTRIRHHPTELHLPGRGPQCIIAWPSSPSSASTGWGTHSLLLWICTAYPKPSSLWAQHGGPYSCKDSNSAR